MYGSVMYPLAVKEHDQSGKHIDHSTYNYRTDHLGNRLRNNHQRKPFCKLWANARCSFFVFSGMFDQSQCLIAPSSAYK